MTGTTERPRTVGSSSSSLIMIHRHTARLIVYRSFTMPAEPAEPAGAERFWRCRYAPTIHMHLCTFLSARPFSASFVISPGVRRRVCLPSLRRVTLYSRVARVMNIALKSPVGTSCVRWIRSFPRFFAYPHVDSLRS